MKNYPLDKIEIDLLGRKRAFYGDLADDYFKNLGAHAAQNDLLLRVANQIDLNSKCFLDVGANIGVTAQMLRMINPKTKIVCFEPSPKAYFYLQKNSDSEMILLNTAAGNQTGTADFFEADFLAGSSINLLVDGVRNTRETVAVPINTIDQLVSELPVENVGLIKVDVEGFELDVLRGAENTIKTSNPVFVCEFNSYALAANGKISPFSFLEHIFSIYSCFYSFRDGKSLRVEGDKDARDWFYQNMVIHGCVEDIYFGGDFQLLGN